MAVDEDVRRHHFLADRPLDQIAPIFQLRLHVPDHHNPDKRGNPFSPRMTLPVILALHQLGKEESYLEATEERFWPGNEHKTMLEKPYFTALELCGYRGQG